MCVQSNEVCNRVLMEKEGFLRSLEFLESAGLNVGAIVTDFHPSIQKYMREQRKDNKHFFDACCVKRYESVQQ